MKKIVSIVLFCVIGANLALFAQRSEEQRKNDFEKFKAEREAFITKEMGLTEDESKAFWPLCNELQEKKFEINKPLRELKRKFRQARMDGKAVSEEDYKKMIELSSEIKIKEAQLEEEYLKKFLKVLSAEKVHKYQHAEHEFAQKFMEQRGRRGNGRS